MRMLGAALLLLTLSACQQDAPPAETAQAQTKAKPAQTAPTTPSADDLLAAALAAQPAEAQARYGARHPAATLRFFGIEPGMTVVEALPGGGWYSKILLQYLGTDGLLIGANYPVDMWPLFGFFSDEQLEESRRWVDIWTADANSWRGNDSARVAAFVMGEMPDALEGTADAVLFIRALHNLRRFEAQGGYLTQALDDAFRVLKPGGIFAVVQHEARPEMPDDWADGSRGYLKREFVIARLEQAGFEFVDAIEINANPDDQPTEADVVWRLPPSLATSRDDPQLREQLEQIGESNRMTLRFRKPADQG